MVAGSDIKDFWRGFYGSDFDERYLLDLKKKDYVIKLGSKEVYREPVQHVDAVAKLMRMPIEVWFCWVIAVLKNSDNNPMGLSLRERVGIFKKSYQETIIKFYQKTEAFAFKNIICPSCHGSIYKNPVYKYTPIRTIAVSFCKECGLGIRFPRDKKEELLKIYEDEYFSGNSTHVGYFDYYAEEEWRIDKAKKYLKILEGIAAIAPGKSRVLDVGSGFGYFLKALGERGYDSAGIELAQEAVEVAKNKFGTKTFWGDLQGLYKNKILKANSFDMITLWDVIEHFYDFRDELKIISKILKPGGYVALRTNNIKSIEFEVFGKDFHSIKNEHTFYYSKKTLTKIFKAVNIEPYWIKSHTHLFLAFMTNEEISKINQSNKGGDIFFVGQKI